MRTLEFDVKSQRIDKVGNFSDLVAGTSGYLLAQFTFSKEWIGCKKAASFWSLGKEYPVMLIADRCEIPPEALKGRSFKVQVTGIRNNFKISTNKVLVVQKGG